MNIRSNKQDESFDHEIVIKRVACPIHVLQMKNGIKQIKSGERLKIATTSYALPELLAAARQLGENITITDKNEIFMDKT